MNIAHIVPKLYLNTSELSGAERYVYELAKAMSSKALTRLISFHPQRVSQEADDLRIELIPPRFYFRGNDCNPIATGFTKYLKDCDILHVHQHSTLLANYLIWWGHRHGQKVFITDLAGGGFNLNKYMNWVNRADGILPISQFSADYFADVHQTPREKMSIIYGGVDIDKFTPGTALREKKIVYVGRLIPHKGIDKVIRAIDPELRLVCLGRPYDDAYFQELQALAVGKNVSFLTDADDARLVHELQTASGAVLFSQPISRRPELLGLVVLEAMACETPVVVSDTGSLTEIVRAGETGFVVPPDDLSLLNHRLNQLLNDPRASHQMGRQARRCVVETFTWELTAERCLQAYR